MSLPERADPTGIRMPEPPGHEPAFNIPGVVLLLLALCIVVHLLRAYVLSTAQDMELIVRAAFIPIRYSGEYILEVYAFTSPVTYSLLHGGVAHLAVNMVWLAAFGSPLATRIGAPRFLLFWVFTALAAVLLHYVLHPDSQVPLVGASGAISGMMGAAARYGFRSDRSGGRSVFVGPILSIGETLRSRTAMVFLGVWMIVNIATGLAGAMPGVEGAIAWEAHIGGLLAGFFGVRLFDRPAPRPR